MNLTESLVALAVFSIPVTASVQLSNINQATEQLQTTIEPLQEAVDADRLQLQANWATLTPVTASPSCITPRQLQAKAAESPAVAPLQRQVLAMSRGVLVSWSVPTQSTPLRRRIYTAMGLGLCR
jgi:hypothetical protein